MGHLTIFPAAPYTGFQNDRLSLLSLPGASRQSMSTAGALFSPAVIMDARNKCGHDMKVEASEDWYLPGFSVGDPSHVMPGPEPGIQSGKD
jgi:hypothetical protein